MRKFSRFFLGKEIHSLERCSYAENFMSTLLNGKLRGRITRIFRLLTKCVYAGWWLFG